jgi:hypothetical protein
MQSYGPSKLRETQLWRSGSPGTKCHVGASPVAKHKVYYKGGGGGFPQVWAVVSFMNLRLLVVRPNTKSVPAMH